jgi:NAD(P)-dependent dehydrogenase (short-subunit alcohol dehydrogenase family)
MTRRFQALAAMLTLLLTPLLTLATGDVAREASGPDGEVPTVLITGASRGIGLELARQYAERGWTVIATAREPARARELREIANRHPGLVIEALDVTDHAQVDALAARYRGRAIDVLINNAAISGGHENARFGSMNHEVYHQVHAVNVVGPVKMAEAFLPHVSASRQKKIINITSGQGSITETWGCCYFYRSSKAALNMMMRNIALELKPKGIIVGLISPGFVKGTGMTEGLNLPMMITTGESARLVIGLINDYTLEKTGTFIAHDGRELPW